MAPTVMTGWLRSLVESVVEKEMDELRGNQAKEDKESPMAEFAVHLECVLENREENEGECKTVKFSFLVVIEQPSGHNCYTGFTKTNLGSIEKSFIEASPINKCQMLVNLCSKHDNLLRVENVVTDPKKGSVYFITEVVYGVEKYFEFLFQNSSPKSNEEWWSQIQDVFWVTFRDIIQGLMFLFKNNITCGNVSLSIFFSKYGKRRSILPSLDPASNSEADMRQLSQIMKTIITFPYPENDDVSFLPEDLRSLFNLDDKADSADSELQVRLFQLAEERSLFRCFRGRRSR